MSTNQPQTTTSTSSRTKGILSLVFGIISIVFSLLAPIIGILSGIAAVVLGFISRRSEPSAAKLALAGIITGFIGIGLNIALIVIGAALLAQYM